MKIVSLEDFFCAKVSKNMMTLKCEETRCPSSWGHLADKTSSWSERYWSLCRRQKTSHNSWWDINFVFWSSNGSTTKNVGDYFYILNPVEKNCVDWRQKASEKCARSSQLQALTSVLINYKPYVQKIKKKYSTGQVGLLKTEKTYIIF